MEDQANQALLGQIAVQVKLITAEQLAAAKQAVNQAGGGKTLGGVLLELGFVDEAKLKRLLETQRKVLADRAARAAAGGAAPSAPRPATAPQNPPARIPVPGPATAAQRPATGAAPAAQRPPAAPAPAGATQRPAAPATSAAAQRPVAPAAAAKVASASAAGSIGKLLAEAVQAGASDLHLHAGSPTRWRLNGNLEVKSAEPLAADLAEKLARSVLSPEQAARFDEQGELDMACEIAGVGRFRVNLYRQQHGMDAVFRVIPPSPPSLEELGLPKELAKLINYHQGLVLVTGPSGCGKSATLAALVDLINNERTDHILSIEDPIEVIHTSKQCVVNQRQVGNHTNSFARALRAALREDPDVIAIGELRDLETISLALTAAETGHLVLATLHTNSSIRTIDRLIGAFPPDQQEQVRTMLSESLRAVISQRLLPRADGKGRVPALEVLIANRAVANLIRENKTFQLRSILQTGANQGMSLMENSLAQLVKSKVVRLEDAARHAEDPKRLTAAGG